MLNDENSRGLYHCLEEANKAVVLLISFQMRAAHYLPPKVYLTEIDLPRTAHGKVRIDRLGFPSFRKCSRDFLNSRLLANFPSTFGGKVYVPLLCVFMVY